MTNYSLQKTLNMEVTTPEQSDLMLWQKVQSGDSETFSSLFKKYYEALYQFSGRLVKDPQTAESIVQDVFVRLWTERENLQIKTSLKSYLYAAVRNHALNNLKQARRVVSIDMGMNNQAHFATSPEIEYLDNEMIVEVHKAIEKLPKQSRQIYLMKRYDNLKYSEIAEILGISINTVKTQMKRAIKSLIKNLAHLAIFPE